MDSADRRLAEGKSPKSVQSIMGATENRHTLKFLDFSIASVTCGQSVLYSVSLGTAQECCTVACCIPML
jgi:hypothetical protein